MDISALRAELNATSAERYVASRILGIIPWIFANDKVAFDSWSERLNKELGMEEASVFVVGSAATGFSLSSDLRAAKDGEIRDLFRRLNINSVVLTDQEFRHAKFKGKFIKLMESLADDEWWSDMRIVNPRQIRRQEDVEYISELFVGLVAGPQDKKKTLDSFYEEFEADMPDSAELAEQFSETRLLIERVLAPNDIRKWSAKSDFYTLFLAFSGFPGKSVLKARKALKRKLMSFQAEVSQAKKKDNTKSFDKDVHHYADAITRAATDVSRRTERLKILRSIMEEAL